MGSGGSRSCRGRRRLRRGETDWATQPPKSVSLDDEHQRIERRESPRRDRKLPQSSPCPPERTRAAQRVPLRRGIQTYFKPLRRLWVPADPPAPIYRLAVLRAGALRAGALRAVVLRAVVLRAAVVRFTVFLAATFLAGAFLAGAFLAGAFLGARFAVTFLAGARLAGRFVVFTAALVRLAGDFFAVLAVVDRLVVTAADVV